MASKVRAAAASVMGASLTGSHSQSSKGTLMFAVGSTAGPGPDQTPDQGTRRPRKSEAPAETSSSAKAATIHGRGFSERRSS